MEVKKICVLGAGTMGAQIVQLAAVNGFEVSMRDIDSKFVENGLAGIRGNLKRFFVDKGKITQQQADAILGRISGTTDMKEAVQGVQVVIESIPEILDLKQKTFQELDKICAPETILATNTSTFLIAAVGSLAKRQDKVIGMHFFNPVAVMKLLEIIRGARTSDDTFKTIADLGVKIGKDAITVNDSPGFVVTRLFQILSNEAARMLSEGVASVEDIDKACQLGLAHVMGPFKTVDVTNGMMVNVHCQEYLRAELGERFLVAPIIKKKALAGEIGVSTGKGFYDYSQAKK